MTKRSKRKTISVSRAAYARIEQSCQQRGVSIAAFVEALLADLPIALPCVVLEAGTGSGHVRRAFVRDSNIAVSRVVTALLDLTPLEVASKYGLAVLDVEAIAAHLA